MTIDLNALNHNFQRVRQFSPHQFIIAMVKANAYGHGLVRVAKALTSADAFGVASLDEGIQLREVGIQKPIVLMEGLFNAEELPEVLAHNFTLVIHHPFHIQILEQGKINKPLSIWLKINSGMNRLGINPDFVESSYQRLMQLRSINRPIGLMTHFAEADSKESGATLQQIKNFNNATRHLKGPRSLANSAAILAFPESHADWVRPGLMLYGASPFVEKKGLDHGLKPVMTLRSRLIAINEIKKGEKVGYGGNFCAPEDMRIGVVGVGYGDGYPQFAQNGTPVLVNSKICDLAGRVSMDMLTVDLRKQPEARIGDPVTLWGENLPVELVARNSKTSPYEILTRMTPRPKIEIKSLADKEEKINALQNH